MDWCDFHSKDIQFWKYNECYICKGELSIPNCCLVKGRSKKVYLCVSCCDELEKNRCDNCWAIKKIDHIIEKYTQYDMCVCGIENKKGDENNE